ncbi:hypothetical protein [Pandoravirus japonicus]|uniref:Uncharacterized protein n=1 Tax=Pandoravirus japonicus TaxID=2823154 RepID=A0A811BTA9_9VIRU|nr:hypothetical protein [Pandoravirus japonicus]
MAASFRDPPHPPLVVPHLVKGHCNPAHRVMKPTRSDRPAIESCLLASEPHINRPRAAPYLRDSNRRGLRKSTSAGYWVWSAKATP